MKYIPHLFESFYCLFFLISWQRRSRESGQEQKAPAAWPLKKKTTNMTDDQNKKKKVKKNPVDKI